MQSLKIVKVKSLKMTIKIFHPLNYLIVLLYLFIFRIDQIHTQINDSVY